MDRNEVADQLDLLHRQAERTLRLLPPVDGGFEARLGDLVHQLRELRDEALVNAGRPLDRRELA